MRVEVPNEIYTEDAKAGGSQPWGTDGMEENWRDAWLECYAEPGLHGAHGAEETSRTMPRAACSRSGGVARTFNKMSMVTEAKLPQNFKIVN